MCSHSVVAETQTFNLTYLHSTKSLPNTCRIKNSQTEMSVRSYCVQKDGLQFKIQIKHDGRYYRNQKKQFVRGYSTADRAQNDIKRLEAYLQTKRIGTFEKQDGDEMEELMARPAKKSRMMIHCSRSRSISNVSGITLWRLNIWMEVDLLRKQDAPVHLLQL